MKFRRILFWSHLATGLFVGLFVLTMSITGILLTYERPIVNMVTNSVKVSASAETNALPIEAVVDSIEANDALSGANKLRIRNTENAPFLVSGRGMDSVLINPFDASVMENPGNSVADGFHDIEMFHRWLGVSGEGRSVARGIIGAANLGFLFLVCSGLYLWLPKLWKWALIRLNLFFRTSYPGSKARDFNWHHVFGIWALIPLFFIVVSGAVFSYPWANKLVYASFGDAVPQRGGPPSASASSPAELIEDGDDIELASLDAVLQAARSSGEKPWTLIDVELPVTDEQLTYRITRHTGNGLLPEQRETLTFDRRTGEISGIENYDDMSAGQKARVFIRYIHTGEQFGLIGATLAGLASIAACFLVYTGFALSFRRLILPLMRKQ